MTPPRPETPRQSGLGGRNLRRYAFFGMGALLFAGLLCDLFGGILFGSGQFGYRDAGYYHYPFAEQILRETSAGSLPLWDPYENLGVPLAGNPAAAVFYPVRILLFGLVRLGVPFDPVYKLYVLVHLAIAFLTFVFLARTPLSDGRPLVSRPGALFGALAWTFGGQILFQTTNIPFLIGAAWLPLLAGAHLRILLRPSPGGAAAAALAAALMIAGGDPQTALTGTLLFIPLFFFVRGVRLRDRNPSLPPAPLRTVLPAFCGSVLLGLALAAVQVVPAAETALSSSRARRPAALPAETAADEMAVYNFSIPPWRTAELFWHDIGGREFPENSRWFSALAEDRQLWTPSLYMGLFPILAALSAFRFRLRRGEGERERLALAAGYIALFAFLAAWGIYGPGWFGRVLSEPGGLASLRPRAGDQTGGIYWLLTRLVPGWTAFRYPAKMATPAALALSLLAGIGLDRFFAAEGRRPVSKRVLLLLVLSVCGLAWGLSGAAAGWMAKMAASGHCKTIYGPLSAEGAASAVTVAMLQTALLITLLAAVSLLTRLFGPASRYRPVLKWAALLILTLDLALAQKWMTRGVSAASFRVRSPIAARLHRMAAGRADPPRLFRDPRLYPASFFNITSPGRLDERLRWDRLTLFQKDAASAGVANLDVRGTFVPAEYLTVSRYLRSELARWKSSGIRGAGLDRLLSALGADAVFAAAGGIRFEEVPRGGQRVHILHHPDRFTEWQDLVRRGLNTEPLPGESARVTRWRPNGLEIEADLRQPGTLLIAEQYWPGWQARLITESGSRPLEVCRLASVLRAVDLPAGRSRVIMEYRPQSLQIGALITAAALLFLFAAPVCRAAYRRRVVPQRGSRA